MFNSKKMTLKPLLESAEGVHLTVYLVNSGSLIQLRVQLRKALLQAYEWLDPVMTVEEKSKFLDPLETLLTEDSIFRQIKGNVGIFRDKDSCRILNIPVSVKYTCQIATSFHVKPLLRWMQTDQEFLLLGIENETAHLYLGSQENFKFVDSILFPSEFKNYIWLNEWIAHITRNANAKLFVAGQKSIAEKVCAKLKFKNIVKTPIADHFVSDKVTEICAKIRKIIATESQDKIEKVFMEFRFADADNRTRKNIFQISKAVAQRRVKKLIISDDLNIFGKIDKATGSLVIHPFDLDHEDDDILDDLAQIVLSQGGEVVVAPKNAIPKGRPILAILDDEKKDLEKNNQLYFQQSIPEDII